MNVKVKVLGMCGALVLVAAVSGPQGRAPVAVAPVSVEESGSGCSGCFCCFPRTADGNVSLNGFVEAGAGEAIVFTVPHEQWFMATDIEVVALDASGNPVADYAVGIFETDRMSMQGGMRTMKRWANCSTYHSARGIPFQPMCDISLDRIELGPPPTDRRATKIYYQINGYLWDDAGAHTGH